MNFLETRSPGFSFPAGYVTAFSDDASVRASGQGLPGPPQGKGMQGSPQGQGMPGPPQEQGMPGPPQGQGMPGPPQAQGMPGPPQAQGMPGPPQAQGQGPSGFIGQVQHPTKFRCLRVDP